MNAPEGLPSEQLLAHAREAARLDEERHPKLGNHADNTLRGWGEAALVELEWSARHTYTSLQHQDYRRAYADEYRRVRAERMVRLEQ
ncbi:MAG: hypothetical protein ACYDCQ_00130 [Dehalococcoidia bacterium]